MAKKRTIYVAEENYSKVTNWLNNSRIQFWNESGAFRFDLLTAIVTAVVVGLVAWGISALN
jgi:hypothetical protein